VLPAGCGGLPVLPVGCGGLPVLPARPGPAAGLPLRSGASAAGGIRSTRSGSFPAGSRWRTSGRVSPKGTAGAAWGGRGARRRCCPRSVPAAFGAGAWVAPAVGAGAEAGHSGCCAPRPWGGSRGGTRRGLCCHGRWGSRGLGRGVLVPRGWPAAGHAGPCSRDGCWGMVLCLVRRRGGEMSSHLPPPPQRSCPVPAGGREVSALLHPAGGHRRRRRLVQGEQVRDGLLRGTAGCWLLARASVSPGVPRCPPAPCRGSASVFPPRCGPAPSPSPHRAPRQQVQLPAAPRGAPGRVLLRGRPGVGDGVVPVPGRLGGLAVHRCLLPREHGRDAQRGRAPRGSRAPPALGPGHAAAGAGVSAGARAAVPLVAPWLGGRWGLSSRRATGRTRRPTGLCW